MREEEPGVASAGLGRQGWARRRALGEGSSGTAGQDGGWGGGGGLLVRTGAGGDVVVVVAVQS